MKDKRMAMRDVGKILDRRITIEKLATVTSDDGFKKRKWIPWRTLWCSKNNLYGKEFYAARAVGEEKTVVFEIRYFDELENINSKEYRILDGKDGYNIIFIDDVKYQKQWVKIKALLRS